ncbi:MAG TPA: DUF6265 family protein [Pyrinomonadaceae bacterium]|nr:DUF6265 family protein [Pyrinomonadaceae bacterium]
MKKTGLLRVGFFLALTAFFIAGVSAKLSGQTPNTTAQTHTINDFRWLVGDWQTAAGGRSQTDEHWTMAAGGSIMGLSRTVAGDRTYEFEYLRIEQRSDGIYYVAHPKARCPGTDFKLTSLTTTEAIFENPAHDFPKRITYRITPEGSLVARVDGGPGGNQAFTFTYMPIKK